MIQELGQRHGAARLVDLAKHFEVTPTTAHKIIHRLQKEKLVSTEPYRALNLTRSGKRLASQSKVRHEIVYRFLVALGVSEETAHIDAEGMEHHTSPETLKHFRTFIKKRNPRVAPQFKKEK